MSALTVGYIGLGIMGKSIARNIIKAGFRTVVHNRTASKAEELVAEGAIAAKTVAELVHQCDIVFTNLPSCDEIRTIVLGPDGIAENSKKGLIYVDNSTIRPATARFVAEELLKKGVFALDAPVSGGDVGARNGTLSIMVGGDEQALEVARPVFMAMGKTVTHIGPAGCGQVAKAANQIMVAAQMVAMGELMILAQKGGADPEKVVAALRTGAASCWTLDVKPQRLMTGVRTPGFKAWMQHKDLAIAMDTAREFGVALPATAVNTQLFQSMQAQGHGDLDNSAVIEIIEQLSNTTLVTKPPSS